MASTGKCPYCGSAVSSSEEKCPSCGAPNENYVPESKRTVFLPKTIEELKEYCAERGMPLLRMRFFIGEDYREPKAFGIYRDGKNVVVYKNKADGSRAIRYRGPDEEHAVNELFQKLLEECHNRGIYPDGKESAGTRSSFGGKKKSQKWSIALFVLLFVIVNFGSCIASRIEHKNDGYYSNGSGRIYYSYGSDWYYTYDDSANGYWYESSAPSFDTEEYYLGDTWTSDWGVSNFKSSSTWDQIQADNSSSSSDYDSWDSSDTDWDSDW